MLVNLSIYDIRIFSVYMGGFKNKILFGSSCPKPTDLEIWTSNGIKTHGAPDFSEKEGMEKML